MGKKKEASTFTANDGGVCDDNNILDGMRIAHAVQTNDTDRMAQILQEVLPGNAHVTVQNVRITKSVGESFTGGRSTPVYYVDCQVCRPSNNNNNNNNNNNKLVSRSFVVKLVVMPENPTLESKEKTIMRRESYAVERRFYNVAAPKLQGKLLKIPKLLASDRDGNKPWPAVCFLMNNLQTAGFPEHPDFMSVSQAQRALQYLAVFHATFWGDPVGAEWRRDLWNQGGFWKQTGAVYKNYNRIAANWVQTVRWMEQKYPHAMTAGIKGLGQRIQSAAPSVATFLAQQAEGPKGYGTLMHGDYKAANLFFAATGDGPESVAAVDFQFAGLGLGAEDVAYLIHPDARGDFFENEELLLTTYHEELIQQLILQCKGGPSTLSYETFQTHYELARIHLNAHWLGKGWVASTEGEMKLILELEKTMDRIDGGKPLRNEDEYVQALAKLP